MTESERLEVFEKALPATSKIHIGRPAVKWLVSLAKECLERRKMDEERIRKAVEEFRND